MTGRDQGADLEAIRAQLQHSYEALRTAVTLAIQICGFLIAANAVLLGYGLSQRHAGFLLVGCAMPVLMAMVGWLTIVHSIPIIYVALKAERILLPNVDTLCSTYLIARGPTFLRRLKESIAAEEHGEQSVDLSGIASWRQAGVHRSAGAAIISLGLISQIGLFVLALTVFGYKLL